jgi:hypothetical protein
MCNHRTGRKGDEGHLFGAVYLSRRNLAQAP